MLTCVVNKSFEPETKEKTFDKTLIGTVSRICERKCHSLRKKEIKVDEVFIPRWEDSPCCSLASEWDIFSGLCENWSLKLKRAKSLEGFPGSSAGKESACNAGDPLVQFLGQEDPLEKVTHTVFLAFPVAQLVKNPHAVQGTWARPLGWEDPLEKGKAAHSSILAWRIPWTIVHGVTESDTTEQLPLSPVYLCICFFCPYHPQNQPKFHKHSLTPRLLALASAALQYAFPSWPVFPCS